jgi:ribosomal protein L19
VKNELLEFVESKSFRKETPYFEVGDTVDVHCKIQEGDKTRVQIFSGIVISRKGHGMNEIFTVRRMVGDEGVERIFRFIRECHRPSGRFAAANPPGQVDFSETRGQGRSAVNASQRAYGYEIRPTNAPAVVAKRGCCVTPNGWADGDSNRRSVTETPGTFADRPQLCVCRGELDW